MNRHKPGSWKSIQELAQEESDARGFYPSYVPNFTTPEKFIEAKIKMLKEHFRIELTLDDIVYLQGFKTEGEINAAVKSIINKHWK